MSSYVLQVDETPSSVRSIFYNLSGICKERPTQWGYVSQEHLAINLALGIWQLLETACATIRHSMARTRMTHLVQDCTLLGTIYLMSGSISILTRGASCSIAYTAASEPKFGCIE